jgi:hypothetical protein
VGSRREIIACRDTGAASAGAKKNDEEYNNNPRDTLIHAGLLAACVVKLSVAVWQVDVREL